MWGKIEKEIEYVKKRVSSDVVTNKIHPLTISEIDYKLRKIHGFKGCFMHDEVVKQPPLKNNESMVINLDNSNGTGTHWVCCFSRDGNNYYFDSFGYPPSDDIKQYLSNRSSYFSSNHIQNIDSVACGYFCCYVIKEADKGVPIYDIIYKFKLNNDKSNDKIVANI